METLKEYEVRLFDAVGKLLFVNPIVAAGDAAAAARGRALQVENDAARYEVVGQLASSRFAGAKKALLTGCAS